MNINLIKKILKQHLDNQFKAIEWSKTLKGKMSAPIAKRKIFYLENSDKNEIELQETNRIIFSKQGSFVKMRVGGKEQKIPNMPAQTISVVNRKEELENFSNKNVNIDAYCDMVCQLLNTYLSNINPIVEIDGEIKEDSSEQLTLEFVYKV